jgi:hypothetical protein
VIANVYKNLLTGTYYRCIGWANKQIALQEIDKDKNLTNNRIWAGFTKFLYKYEPDLICPINGPLRTMEEAENIRKESECC